MLGVHALILDSVCDVLKMGKLFSKRKTLREIRRHSMFLSATLICFY